MLIEFSQEEVETVALSLMANRDQLAELCARDSAVPGNKGYWSQRYNDVVAVLSKIEPLCK